MAREARETVDLSTQELSDRIAIRELIDAYARCADRRDAEGQMALFTADTTFVVHMDGQGAAPTTELHGREQLAPVFENLDTYETTTHFNGQSSITVDGDRATGESYCMAHHAFVADGARKLMVAAIRYDDVMTRSAAGWRFAQRRLYVDWVETRTLG